MFNRSIRFLKEACYYLFWSWVVFLHLVLAFVIIGCIYSFGII